ncbi:unnamed protein product [Paramecium sonneborni]|uniref:Uncharacterized protein n=1 Tax=Paramecium sonneborni TaxID=65129 RepID=A0A8S1L6H4_9CILI|nr:unnamed protein product [Paramecium sonneborni]
MQQLQIGLVLLISCLAFFLLGYQWAVSNQKPLYDSIGSDDDEQKLEQQLKEYKKNEENYKKQIQDLTQKLEMKNSNKNTNV